MITGMYCTVITASRSSAIGNGLTYELDQEGVAPGSPVRVPLRRGLVEGIVVEIVRERADEEYDLKKVTDVLGTDPLVSEAGLRTARWMSEYYACSLRQALGVWLPATPWSGVLPKDVVGYRLRRADSVKLRGKKQSAVAERLMESGWMPRARLMEETGASASVISTLLKAGVLQEERRREEEEQDATARSPLLALPTLTPAQEAAVDLIRTDERPALIFGVTGSGKTEIYAKLIADAVSAGGQAILLLPEILLTEHFIGRFQALIEQSAIAVVHSRLTPAQRREQWRNIRRGAVSLVIGSRSALFAPLQRLKLVIIDEEHEWTYKNEQSPRYHARETAETLCRFSGAKLVLGSATPSVESWARTKNGRYALARLPLRYMERPLPNVRVVDLAEVQFGSLYPFSPSLIAAIKDRLNKQEQIVLFLNRRGIATALLCLQCRRRVICPDSQLPYTVHHTHSGRPYLLDHTTGLMADVPAECPNCKSTKLHAIGAGTQRIEMLVNALFPEARLIRADADTIQRPEDMRSLLRRMRDGEADILLGTQSVVKGLDLPGITLAAVLLADIGLSLPHFRAGERVFQLLTQLTGRSGRAKPGEVIIQTFRPQAPEVVMASRHETEQYLDAELRARIHAGYPPATRIIRLIIRGDDPQRRAKILHTKAMAAVLKNASDLRVSMAPAFFGGGKVWHILLRGANPASLLASLDLKDIVVDVDPIDTL